ncbi:aldo/keto reductase [Prauserella cavernicola]|uniref:Aldo/keto reductase n=1 Tax=Prauserella cavernicola TaxID=2800127 RepID=A0A934QVM5_9PSEU|nr:aldo/keto reductase [Prauserella cavernicola]MBK1787218.1 aldo/keto reductase [Prauserella cavernicola]
MGQRTPAGSSPLGRQGFGAMRLRENETSDIDRDPFRVIGAVLDAGVSMIDTAEMYGNEALVGRAIAARRDEVVLASKFGVIWNASMPEGYEVRADPAYVRQACEASLRRLRTDHIELYYLHHRSATTPIEDTVGAMAELVGQGKIGAIGLSNVTADDLRRAHAVHPVTALQEHWSLAERTLERELVPTATGLGVTVVAHSPTSHGALHNQRGDDSEAERQLLLRDIAAAHQATVGQVAIAWVHSRADAHGLDVVPLPGTTSVTHARSNVAAGAVTLTSAESERLTDAWTPKS